MEEQQDKSWNTFGKTIWSISVLSLGIMLGAGDKIMMDKGQFSYYMHLGLVICVLIISIFFMNIKK